MQLSVAELEQHISDLRARLPRHSVPAAMLLELEELEDELERRAGERELKVESWKQAIANWQLRTGAELKTDNW